MSLPALDVNRLPQPVAPSEPQRPEPDAKQVIRHLAHEMRQPLSALESLAYYLDIILPQSEVKARQQIDRIQQLVTQTNWIMDDAIHYMQAVSPNPIPVSLDDLVTQTIAERGLGRSLRLQLDLSAEPCVALVDRAQGHHLVANLVSFLRHTVDADTFVTLATQRAGSEVELRVEGTTSTLNAIELPGLFEPFTVSLPAGAGLSLASAKRIVDAHQGSLMAELSESGALSLKIRLPAA